jgi:hypothetical protein
VAYAAALAWMTAFVRRNEKAPVETGAFLFAWQE